MRMNKKIATALVVVVVLTILFFVGKALFISWMMSVPEKPFDQCPIPAAPDYSKPDHWAALPDRKDSADQVPPNCGYTDQQANAKVDVFFVHPTSAFYGDTWNASMDNLLANLAIDRGIIPQHATAFNAVGKIYAPRYRQVRMPIWWADDKDSVEKAVNLAYHDVKKSFYYYLQHWNNGRPIILASHSQGTRHLRRLIREEFDGKPLTDQLVAAYIIGNTVPVDDFSEKLPICESAEQVKCYVTWNTVVEGGSSYHWVEEAGLEKISCVNPLSWKADLAKVDKSKNQGSVPMIGVSGLGEVDKNLVGARCGGKGILWIDKPEAPGYDKALFEGGSYHTYDINFYYDSIRKNAQLRVDMFFEQLQADKVSVNR